MSFTCALCSSSLTFPYVCKSIFLSLAECLIQVVSGVMFSLGLTFCGLLFLWLWFWVVIWISTGCLDWLLFLTSIRLTELLLVSVFGSLLECIWLRSCHPNQLLSLRTRIWTSASLIKDEGNKSHQHNSCWHLLFKTLQSSSLSYSRRLNQQLL